MRTLITTLSTLTLLLWTIAAHAQGGRPRLPNYGPPNYSGGTVSPYLGIVGGNNTGINYFLNTRSEFQRRNDSGQFRSDIGDLYDRDAQGGITSGTAPLPNTFQRYFNNTRGYFAPAGPTIPLRR